MAAITVLVGLSLVSTNNKIYAATISSSLTPVTQTYGEGSAVYPGMLVQQETKNPTEVIPLTNATTTNMVGVVIPQTEAAVTLTKQNATGTQVLVANGGNYSVLVSNENGPIATGDYLGMSSISGVADKATTADKDVIGRANGKFNGTSGVIGNESYTNQVTGQKENYAISLVPANIQLAPNPIYVRSTSGLPSFIIKAAYVIANKPVSPIRIYLSFGIVLTIIVVVGSMFYGGVRSGLISIGRNPLSQKSIARGLLQTLFGGILIFIIGVGMAYMILKL